MRKHIGRALLNKPGHSHASYYDIWNVDLTSAAARAEYRERRDITAEQMIEMEVSEYMLNSFRFRYVPTPNADLAKTIEEQCIGVLSACPKCRRSEGWLGRHHRNKKIAKGNLWNIRGVTKHFQGTYPFDDLAKLI